MLRKNSALSIFIISLLLSVTTIRAAVSEEIPDTFSGETITYAVKKLGVKAGEATLSFQGLTTIQSKETYLIVLKAKALNFYDEEKIYVDPKTFYPQIVLRNLNIWGKREKITEEYFPDRGLVKITKTANGKTSSQEIQKDGKLDNIYSFIYRYRRDGNFIIGDQLAMHLPTKDVSLELEKKTKLSAAGEQFESYYMKSDPNQYQVWFDASSDRIPLRINGAVGFGDTAMIMTRYQNSKGKVYD